MKYGIYNAYWTHEWSADYEYYIPKVKKLGFDVLEISCAALTSDYASDAKIRDLKQCADDNGIILTAGYGPTKEQNLCSSDPEVVEKAMEFFKMILPKLQKMDIHILGGGLYSYWPLDPTLPMDKEKDTERAIKNMKRLSVVAEDCGVVLGMEVLNRFEGYIMNTCAEGLAFIRQVDSPNVKVMLDTFHMNIEEDNIGAAIRLAGKDLCHLHLGE
jgi:D-psicose/D-tagatose/L-ribulose 3-epimerase